MNNQKGFAPIVIILIVVGILAVAGGVWYWQSHYGLFCAKTGLTLTTRPDLPKLPLIGKYNCCKGLSMISAAPEAKYMEINGEYVPPLGSGIICSDCGNKICEQWEHKYSCPRDCVKDETADWKTYVNNDYGFGFKYPQTFFLDSQLIDLGNGSYGFDNQTKQLNSDVSPSATHLYVNFAKFSSLVDNKETCINGICSRKSPMEDQQIINQASVGDEIKTNSGFPGKVVSIGDVKGFRYLGYNPQAKAYSTGVVVFNSLVDQIELSMSIAALNETQAENDKFNKDFDQIISTFWFRELSK